jgi:gamma-glutamylcyclotransferase (GGCT)/AIG2-like uncharacterized protein YtfP
MAKSKQTEPFNLFVYGTLMDPSVFRAVLGLGIVAEESLADGVETFHAQSAVLDGYKKVSPDNTYQYAVPDKHHRIRGYFISGLPRESLSALNLYEGTNYRRRTLQIQTEHGLRKAVVFVGNIEGWEHAFGYAFGDDLKQEILLEKKIDAVIRDLEQEKLQTDEELTRLSVMELSGPQIRDIRRRHFEAGGISDFVIREALKSRPLPDYDRIRNDERARKFVPHYLRMVFRQVVFNQFEGQIRKDFRYELDHLPQAETYYERVISSLLALRILNRSKAILDTLAADTVSDLPFCESHLIDYVRRAVLAAEALYDPKTVRAQFNFVRSHMGFGYLPLGAELEFSNIGPKVIHDPDAKNVVDRVYDGFLYFYDFGLDLLTWKLGGHIDNHREKAPGKPRRGFFEVAIGNLSIEANISKPITRDPWVLNQLIHQTRLFYDVTPHSIHLSMQLRSQHKPDQDRVPPLHVLQCLFAIAGDPERTEDGRVQLRRLVNDEIIMREPAPSMLFSDVSKRYSRGGEAFSLVQSEPGLYVQQFRFLRLSGHLNYEPIIMGLKGIQIHLRPGTFLKPTQWKKSKKHRDLFEMLMEWGQNPEPIPDRDVEKFLEQVTEGLQGEKRGKPAHSRAYIAWSASQLEELIRRFNTQLRDPKNATWPKDSVRV